MLKANAGAASFGTASMTTSPLMIVSILCLLAVAVMVGYMIFGSNGCPTEIIRLADGTLQIQPSGQIFPDMNSFQQWWHGNGDVRRCALPILKGAREVEVLERPEDGNEQLWAKTPINKVDDYEFSRIFGYERNGRMEVPRQNFNLILDKRSFDWPTLPYSSDERQAKYGQIVEGFTADGDLKSIVFSEPTATEIAREATARYGERTVPVEEQDPDLDCHLSREAKEVAAMVAKAYESDPNYEPIVTKVGPHQWEVNELRPLRRKQDNEYYTPPVDERVVDMASDAVDIRFNNREAIVVKDAIDPYFPEDWASTGGINDRQLRDPYYGPVPNMERMFGPTFDHEEWYKVDGSQGPFQN